MKTLRRCFILFYLLLAFGCAGGKSYDYTKIPIDLYLDGNSQKLAVGVHDQREYIRKGEKYNQYVGTQRSPAYVPWNVNTRSGLPMADDFLNKIAKSLEANKYIVDKVSLSEKEDKKIALSKLKATGSSKLLLFIINEWFFDVYYKTRMTYSMRLEVYDNKENLLSCYEVNKNMWGDKDNAVPDLEFKAAVEQLITDDSTVQGLNPDFSNAENKNLICGSNHEPIKDNISDKIAAAAPDKNSSESETVKKEKNLCTANQILEMKKLGMADEQIKAACK